MPSLTLPGRLIWFAHVPKAGGTSVERVMVGTWGPAVGHLHWGWDLWWKQGGWRRAGPACSPQHLTWDDAQGVLPRAPDAVFAVVRDPLARMLSEYRYQRHARRGTPLGRALAHLPFSLWLGIVLRIAARNPYAFDNHLRPQSDFVPGGARVFRLEEGLGPALDWLTAAAGAVPVAAVPRELTGRPGPEIRLSSGDIRLIVRTFAGDYARFGYAIPDADGFPGDRVAPVHGALARLAAPLFAPLERCAKL